MLSTSDESYLACLRTMLLSLQARYHSAKQYSVNTNMQIEANLLTDQMKVITTEMKRIEAGDNRKEKSQLELDKMPSFYLSTEGRVCTHRFHARDTPLWTRHVTDSLNAMQVIANLNQENADLKRDLAATQSQLKNAILRVKLMIRGY